MLTEYIIGQCWNLSITNLWNLWGQDDSPAQYVTRLTKKEYTYVSKKKRTYHSDKHAAKTK